LAKNAPALSQGIASALKVRLNWPMEQLCRYSIPSRLIEGTARLYDGSSELKAGLNQLSDGSTTSRKNSHLPRDRTFYTETESQQLATVVSDQ
jgi:X-X-X-Leu-X-X-Gly heptad repeat protein